MIRFGSVCSGIEAASVAWRPLGWEASWFAEIEPFPCAVLAHRYPDVPNLGDMTTLPERIRTGEVEAPDVFCGGTPCQAFSVAGLRRSLDDARGNLSLTFCEIANAIDFVRAERGEQPAVVFWENVPGVLSTKDNAFGCFLAGLAGEADPLIPPGGKWANAGVVLGPQRAVAWRTLDAQYFGLAQRRRRVFVVASARTGFDPAAVLFEWEGVRRDTPPSRQAGKDAAGALASRTDGGGFPGTGEACSGYVQPASGHYLRGMRGEVPSDGRDPCARPGGMPEVRGGEQPQSSRPVVAFGGNRTSGSIDISPALLAQPGSGYKGDFESETFRVQPTAAYAVRTANTSANGHGVSPELAHTLDRAQGQCVAFNAKDSGSDASENLSGTLRCGGKDGGANWMAVAVRGQNGHNEPKVLQVRRLTAEECEFLQGFPRSYTAIPWRGRPASQCPDGPRYKALGNSWAVPVVRWIGARILNWMWEDLC